jgi:hypothetical protein
MNIQYEELMDQIEELCCMFNAFAIAIDGMAFAGKTDLAAHLSKKFGAPIIHMSDFLLPEDKRPDGWETTPGGEVDFERFDEEIVQKWLKQKPIVYDIHDPKTGEVTDRIALPDGQIYIVEGTYCLHPAILDFYDLRLFLQVPKEEQAKRAEAAKKPLSLELIARHDRYFTTYMTELLADFTIDNSTFIIPDPVEVPEGEEDEAEVTE